MKHLLALLLSVSLAFGELIPDRRKGQSWASAGVTGGLAAKRAAIVTASMIDITASPYSVDNTGTTTIDSAFNSAKAAMTTEHGIYFPAGLYKLGSKLSLGAVNGKAIRGAGAYTTSTSTVTVNSSGTKTFTVPAGLPYTTGCGIWVREVEEISNDTGWSERQWMQGTVSSYSGTTLTINVTSASGNTGNSFDRWFLTIVGFTLPSGDVAGGFRLGPAIDDYMGNPSANAYFFPTVVGSPTRGATSITIDLGSTGYATPIAGDIALIVRNFQRNAAAGHADDSRFEVNTTGAPYSVSEQFKIGTVTSLGGGQYTIGVSPAFDLDYPTGLDPRVTYRGNGGADYARNSGLEGFTIIATGNLQGGACVEVGTAIDCWIYDVALFNPRAAGAALGNTINCEVRKTWLSHRSITGAGGLLFSTASTKSALVEDNIFTHHSPNIEVNGNTIGSVFAYNTGLGAVFFSSHSFAMGYNLYEGNVIPVLLSDGYHGGEFNRTTYRNHLIGLYNVDAAMLGARWSYNFSDIGNVLGITGSRNGLVVNTGQPNMGSTDDSGLTVSARAGTYWKHLTGSGGIAATLASKTDSQNGVLTLTTLVASDLEDPHLAGSATSGNMWLFWGNGDSTHRLINITITSRSGSSVGVQVSGTLPDVGTAMTFYTGNAGYQEVDSDVPGTQIHKGNYVVTGGSGSMSSLGGDTLLDSLYLSGKPTWFGDLAFPPVDPASPSYNMTNGITAIPAGYRYANLSEVPGAGGGGGSANATIQTLNVGTLNIQ
jgi:hypothetical protein